MPATEASSRSDLLSIGQLAKATQIPAPTLRTWERRYGVPEPIRLPSGHRRYRPGQVDRLRMAKRAIDGGMATADALSAEPLALARPSAGAETDGLDDWIQAATQLDSARLHTLLREAWDAAPMDEVVERYVLPFVRRLGTLWVNGEIGIIHEHMATELIVDFLSQRWRQRAVGAIGPVVVLATLPGERHVVGLHLSAAICADTGCRPVFIGPDTPVIEVVAAAQQMRADAVLVGTSAAADARALVRKLSALRRALAEPTQILVGGQPVQVDGVRWVADFRALRPALADLRR